MKYYFAYGSNLDVDRLEKERLNKGGIYSVSRGLGRLDGYELVFNKPSAYFPGAGAANIQPNTAAHIFGTLNLMPQAGFDILDIYENVETQQYEQLEVDVVDMSTHTTVKAITYISLKHNVDGLKPRTGYMNHILAGADVLPAAYIDYLKSLPVMPD
ncbi:MULTISPECIES: gamma-glutamylcyclotransferase [Rhizobium/Agrobacterium group]|uniref:Gamma-glutamylcyclotransferase n=2 Tax=Rhizobium/Agrobacterium group TaxID=227290 RepID=B9JT38_ALLAM|nr:MULTISPECIES: gamma-glutamylcyclotransferase [Rhizobium/Agrobacterium group]ACM35751.1 Conserved hypothetical protein [Allorhizobium ampelinum S4]MCF1434699.1 gamma-glutamylcyclotransferase [Allorhizobium ampelinum]MCF1447759.1 gamma-glutamylcyclotransferase [Allorhizobium ampelinum]MCF1493852.1 gamma-glutamylcyclotransferase [Allorhizobium ampelinum]MUO30467.1 gamma-glutamylcyclotransferase [Agrobacterium vitis]